jgi:hypothetical protein
VHSPYTAQPLDALLIAQTSVGLTLTALVWARPLRSKVASVALVAATWLSVWNPVDSDYLGSIGVAIGPNHSENVLRLAAVLAGIAAVLSGRRALAIAGVLGAGAFWWLRSHITHSDWEMAATDLAFVGLLLGIHYRSLPPRLAPAIATPAPSRSFARDDAVIFTVATTLAAVVSAVILRRHTNSGDEVANTYQAALFARGHAYEAVPPCSEAFRSFWVYQYLGRSFAQYTPGWPLFMVPFVMVRAAWLAGPFALGLLAVGVARIARRAAAGFSPGTVEPSRSEVRAAGFLGGLALTLGSTMLINGASRYPHVFVAAMFAWSVEGLLRIADGDLRKGAQWLWGGTLGMTAALLLAARPADGATLGVGLFAYFVVALFRRRIGARALLGAALGFALWGGLTLVILRLQVGTWFKTGYSLTEIYYPWNKFTFSRPQPDEIRAGIPLASGAYCWWPCAPAIGLAGLAALRGRARRIAFIMFVGFVPFFAFYTLFDIGRHGDFAYGPRYQFPCVVPMAVGTGAILAQLWREARTRIPTRSALRRGGPFALALAAAILGIVRIAPLVYGFNYNDVRDHNRLQDALEKADLRNSVVLAQEGISNTSSMDLTESLPLQFYPDQDVIIARDLGPDSNKCVRDHFPNRTILQAIMSGGGVRLVPDTRRK